jgi:hypothetical protein
LLFLQVLYKKYENFPFNLQATFYAQFTQLSFTEFASLLGSATMKVAGQFSTLTKDFAGVAAERVKTAAVDLRNFTSIMYVVALEEKERARRLSDPNEIIAINNAWFQSQLIRDLSALCIFLLPPPPPSFPISSIFCVLSLSFIFLSLFQDKSSSLPRYPLSLVEECERRWRLSTITPNASRKIAALVNANHARFDLAMERAAERERVHAEAIAHSRLNPRAPAFVPHQAFGPKVEPAPVARTNVASGAQL